MNLEKRDQLILDLKGQGLTYAQMIEPLKKQGFVMTENYLCKRYKRLVKTGMKPEVFVPAAGEAIITPTASRLSIEQIRKRHDKFYIVSKKIAFIPKDMFIEESELLKELGLLGKPGSKEVTSRMDLKENRGKADGIVYFGHRESIERLKREGVLQ